MKPTDIATLRERARAGDPGALRILGMKLLLGEGVAPAPREGVALLTDAAARGDGEANAQLALFAAWGVLRPRSLPAALEHLQRAAELGWTPSRRELQFLAHSSGTDWQALRQGVDLAGWTSPRPSRVISRAPQVRLIEGFATAAECAWLIQLARRGLRRAMVYRKDVEGHTEAQTRTNSEADYTIGQSDLVLRLVIDRIAAATGVASTFFEVAKLLHYEPGQHFAPHVDFQDPATPALAREVERRGQRVATVLVYLNDDYDGGETDFPRIGLRHKATIGDALLFANVDPAGALDYDTLHAGLPPTRGVKWVLSQWIRDRPVTGP
jgi:predicted 2-oxoglutarate/Fe(II)-dependent dioxygenase YbiX